MGEYFTKWEEACKQVEDLESKVKDLEYENNQLERANTFVTNRNDDLEREIDILQSEFEQFRRESIKWSVEDFTGYYKEHYHEHFKEKGKTKLKLTDQKAQDMLIEMINNHDASLGITWDTIESMLDQWLHDEQLK